ncbi:transmembrane sensor [Sphingobium xenophagum]|uniref:Transmembrane sensor n=1 Tax=Sphingobium xenophagum TaxID=121428 RepID=A0ABU1WX73_SPHXE|nr:DUF4880 domain-containing protein [Sphingobium xenophagum]MDR7153889.1 transmembrane sensor [Sphingobium xenophagum]
MHGERPLDRTAAEWIARLNADDRSAADEEAFRVWLAASPRNAAAFEQATDLWAMVPGSTVKANARPLLLSRRRILAACAGTLVVGGAGTVAMQSALAGTRYETGIGEQRRVALAEGSSLFLDAATRVRVLATTSRRRLWLDQGRVSLVVTPAPVPFTIALDDGAAAAGPGQFDLRRDSENRLALTALSGQAEVALNGKTRRLDAGERMRARNDDAVLPVDRPDLEATQAWQSGRAAFQDDPLTLVVAEANRYSPTKLVIADPGAADLRVSGMYRMGDNLALAQALGQLLSIRVRRVNETVLLGG